MPAAGKLHARRYVSIFGEFRLQAFLSHLPTQATPDDSTLSRIRQRLPEVAHEHVFSFVLHLTERKGLGLLAGQTVAIDATLLEAKAAMKSIRRGDNATMGRHT